MKYNQDIYRARALYYSFFGGGYSMPLDYYIGTDTLPPEKKKEVMY